MFLWLCIKTFSNWSHPYKIQISKWIILDQLQMYTAFYLVTWLQSFFSLLIATNGLCSPLTPQPSPPHLSFLRILATTVQLPSTHVRTAEDTSVLSGNPVLRSLPLIFQEDPLGFPSLHGTFNLQYQLDFPF